MDGDPTNPGSSGTGLLSVIEKARQRQAAQRAFHLAWKQRFFLSRPPPPARERLHRMNHHEGRYRGAHAAFALAKSLHHASPLFNEKQELGADGARPVGEAVIPTSLSSSSEGTRAAGAMESPLPFSAAKEDTKHEAPTSISVDHGTSQGENVEEDTVSSRRERWLHQMRSEREHRLPCADLQIRSDPLRTVVIANLCPTVVEEELRRFANQFGRVTQCRVVHSTKTGRCRGYGFVEFGLRAEAKAAVSQSRRRRLGGRVVPIEMERGRVDPAFLPKRLAAAAEVEARYHTSLSDSHSQSRKRSNNRRESAQGKPEPESDVARASGDASMGGKPMIQREDDTGKMSPAKKRMALESGDGPASEHDGGGAVNSALALLSIEADNEDDYLNAILNAGL